MLGAIQALGLAFHFGFEEGLGVDPHGFSCPPLKVSLSL
jgi:hypothetical protein